MYWEDDDMKLPLDEVAKHEPHVYDLRDKLLVMNGKCAHAVEAFEGTRYSIILYTQRKYQSMKMKMWTYYNKKDIFGRTLKGLIGP